MFRLLKFCIVGGINTFITLICFYVLNKILHINYLTSTIIGYFAGMCNSYLLNKRWTFSDKDTRIVLQFIKFVIVNSISLSINLVIMYLLVDTLYLDSMLSQIIATIFSTISNYIGNKVLVFRYSIQKHEIN